MLQSPWAETAMEMAGPQGRPGARATGSYHPDPLAAPKGALPARDESVDPDVTPLQSGFGKN